MVNDAPSTECRNKPWRSLMALDAAFSAPRTIPDER